MASSELALSEQRLALLAALRTEILLGSEESVVAEILNDTASVSTTAKVASPSPEVQGASPDPELTLSAISEITPDDAEKTPRRRAHPTTWTHADLINFMEKNHASKEAIARAVEIHAETPLMIEIINAPFTEAHR